MLFNLHIMWLFFCYCALDFFLGIFLSAGAIQYTEFFRFYNAILERWCTYIHVCVCVYSMHKSRIVLLPVPRFSRDGLAVILRSKNRDSSELMIFAHLCLTLLQAVFALSHESTSAETNRGF